MAEDSRFVRCERCQLSMRVRVQPGNPEARLMRFSGTDEGFCADCAATEFLYRYPHIKSSIDGKRELLLWKPVQTQFALLMQAGHADAKPPEIDWQAVHDNWELPFPKARRGGRQKR